MSRIELKALVINYIKSRMKVDYKEIQEYVNNLKKNTLIDSMLLYDVIFDLIVSGILKTSLVYEYVGSPLQYIVDKERLETICA